MASYAVYFRPLLAMLAGPANRGTHAAEAAAE
jgi:hypothetical protein